MSSGAMVGSCEKTIKDGSSVAKEIGIKEGCTSISVTDL